MPAPNYGRPDWPSATGLKCEFQLASPFSAVLTLFRPFTPENADHRTECYQYKAQSKPSRMVRSLQSPHFDPLLVDSKCRL